MSVSAAAVLVPVKPPARGKSRLVGLPGEQRRRLAAAFALDTVAAALGTPGVEVVVAVTDDFRFAAELASLGCEVLPDGVGGDLNGTLRQAAADVVRQRPGLHLVALCADLPAMTARGLTAVLAALPPDRAGFVRDAAGSGTTLYAAPADSFAPAFGPGSAALHADQGALEITGAPDGLRHDVDDLDDLDACLRLGVGMHTAALTDRQRPGRTPEMP